MKMGLRELSRFWRLKIKYPLYYRLCALGPLDREKAVFIENRFPRITDSFSLLHQKLCEEYQCRVTDCFLLEVDGTRKEYDRRCMAMIREAAGAAYVFVNDASNVVGCLPFRKGTKVIQVWHACGAFKKWGFSNASGKFGADYRELLRYPYYANYALVTVSSPEVAWAYADAFHLPEQNDVVKATGVSRTDIFFDPKFREEAFARLYKRVPQAKGKKVVLYAPTFRGKVRSAQSPANLNQQAFCGRFADQYVLLCKHHPSVKKRPPVEPGCENTVFDVTNDMSIEELLVVSDVCITDYSSIVFEYSLFERPIIIYAYDLDSYIDARGFYYKFEDFVPGPIVKDNRALLDCLAQIDRYDLQKVRDFREKYMGSCDGGATERILQTACPELKRKNFHEDGSE